MAARLMRRVLVDSARAKGYQKRGGGAVKVTFDEGALPAAHTPTDLVALDDALTALGRRSGPARTPAFVASRLHTANRTGRASQRAVIEATRVHDRESEGRALCPARIPLLTSTAVASNCPASATGYTNAT